jgi:HK97 family phage major capsid protein
MTVFDLIEKRNKAWDAAKAFVESRRGENGLLSAEDAKTYSEMEQKVKDYGAEIERLQAMEAMEAEMKKPLNTPLTEKPMGAEDKKPKTGRASDEYKKGMLTALRSNFKQITNVMSEGVDADGYATFSTPSSINGNTKTWAPNHNIGQCWYASIGIRYIFN